jgi:hypothetical protein
MPKKLTTENEKKRKSLKVKKFAFHSEDKNEYPRFLVSQFSGAA